MINEHECKSKGRDMFIHFYSYTVPMECQNMFLLAGRIMPASEKFWWWFSFPEEKQWVKKFFREKHMFCSELFCTWHNIFSQQDKFSGSMFPEQTYQFFHFNIVQGRHHLHCRHRIQLRPPYQCSTPHSILKNQGKSKVLPTPLWSDAY